MSRLTSWTGRPSSSVAYINHVALVIDGSGSMAHLKDNVVQVADELIASLAEKSRETDQETRISLYVFEDRNDIKCHVYDKDVLRMPSLKGLYRTVGMTPLIDATMKSISDLRQTATLYGDHAFLIYVLTDGLENASFATEQALRHQLGRLEENWTIACFVPNVQGRDAARNCGLPDGNIQIWEASAKGLTAAASTIKTSINSYYTMRSTGVRGSANLFSMDLGGLSKSAVTRNLTPLTFGQYRLFEIKKDTPISTFVERELQRPYRLGEGYYQLLVPVKVQPAKRVCIFDRKKHVLYAGDDARQLLGLPNHEVKLAPAAHKDFDIFIQSTSTNRKLLSGQKLVILS